jgi:diguanylate cyclase (GGDEF)-like protein/PAS domain S-box-containing protein
MQPQTHRSLHRSILRRLALLATLALVAIGWAALQSWQTSQTQQPMAAQGAKSRASAAVTLPSAETQGIEVFSAHTGVGPGLAVTLLVALALTATTVAVVRALVHLVRRQEQLSERERCDTEDQQHRLEAVLDASSEGIVLGTRAGVIELVNRAAAVMFGQADDDMLGKHLAELIPQLPLDREPWPAVAGKADAPLPDRLDVEIPRADGAAFPARVWLHRLHLDGGLWHLLVIQDQTESTQQAQQLEFLEQRDVITGLLNRREFERRIGRLLAGAANTATPYVLCYIDMDQFKLVNDTAGHAAGDALIEQLATLIEVNFDDAALLARLGGDEFGALFADRTEAQVLSQCDALMQTIRSFRFNLRDRHFGVAVSIGVTAFLPQYDSAAAELAKADVACLMAKRDGRDRIHVYSDGDASAAHHHGEMHLVSTISGALNKGRFRLYAQPIMPLAAGGARLIHYEILVRMLDEQGAPVVPDHFIPAAERYILMPAVDRWIIHQLFSTQADKLRAWHADHRDQFLFAVNLSGTSLGNEGFLPFLKHQFESQRIPPASICFELTETAAIRSLHHARDFIRELAAMGCSFALDDFGSGLSSFNYLRELPVNYLKIDGSFVRDMNSNPVNYALVASINQIAHVLGLKSIAEWAENDSIVNQLRALNVDYAQGYAIGTPLPVTDCDFDIASALASG